MLEKEIRNFDEIVEADVKYFQVESGERTGKILWVQTENYREGKEFSLNFDGTFDTFEIIGQRVRSWKTFKGVLRFMQRQVAKLYSYSRYEDWFTKEQIEELRKANKVASDALAAKQFEAARIRNEQHAKRVEKFAKFLESLVLPDGTKIRRQFATFLEFEYDGMVYELDVNIQETGDYIMGDDLDEQIDSVD